MNGSNYYDARQLHRNYPYDKKSKKSTAIINKLAEIREFEFIRDLYVSRFKWDMGDMPISEMYMELNLFERGLLCFYKDPQVGDVILPCTISAYNIYGEPTVLHLFGVGGTGYYDKKVAYDKNKTVLIYASKSRRRPADLALSYSRMLADAARGAEVYSHNLKKPVIIAASFNKAKSIEMMYQDIRANEDVIILDNKLYGGDEQDIGINYNSSHNANDLKGLYMYKQFLLTEVLTQMGVRVPPIIKSAQQTEDEINKNDMTAQLILTQNDECRQNAVNKINEIADSEILCENVADYVNDIPDVDMGDKNTGGDNG